LKESDSFQQIGDYAINLTALSKVLLDRAILNGLPNHEELEKEMCDSGIDFIQKFVSHFKTAEKRTPQEITIIQFPQCN
jgi:hypothetical protein